MGLEPSFLAECQRPRAAPERCANHQCGHAVSTLCERCESLPLFSGEFVERCHQRDSPAVFGGVRSASGRCVGIADQRQGVGRGVVGEFEHVEG